ncbi:oligomeric Golgi complex subunit 7, partial [Dichotomocladium elegans]
NIKKWINATLNPLHKQADTVSEALPSEQEVTVLVTRLQISSDQLSRKVGQVTDGIVKSMPRMLYDLKLITDDAQSAKRGIDQVKVHLDSTQNEDTETALKKLEQLHIVKTRMEKCCQALKEAENWSNLETEATKILEQGDYEAAAGRLQSAKHSLDMFQHSPEYDRRRELLKRLEQQLEDALRPKVTAALEAHHQSECFRYYKVFAKMGRADDFVDLYFEVRNPKMIAKWQKNEGDQEWIDNLDAFYKDMFKALSEEYIWSASIFPDPKPVAQAQVQNILQCLDPSIADRLASIATHQGPKALSVLVSAFVVTESFGLSLERLFSRPPVNTASADPASLESIKSRARRRSISSQLTLVPLTLRHADTNTWSYVLYIPFLPFQSQYAALESRYLTEQLASLFRQVDKYSNRSAAEVLEMIKNDTIQEIFALARGSLDRCLKLTHGFGAIEWLRSLNAYMNQVKQHMLDLMEMVQNGDEKERFKKRLAPALRGPSDHDDADLEQETPSWPAFQLELRLVGICQALDSHLKAFEDTILHALESVKPFIQEKDMDDNPLLSPLTPSQVYPRASMALLRTSRLNSHELQRIIGQTATLNEESEDNVVRVLLREAYQAIAELTARSQRMLHNAILDPIAYHFDQIKTLNTVWTAPDPQPRKSVVEDATIDIDMPQFSLSPNEYITRVGEKLLMLPQEFEVYVDDKSLAYHLESAPYILKSDLSEPNDDEGEENREQNNSYGKENDEIDDEGSSVIELWTTSVARGTMDRFLNQIRKIQKTTPQGRRQLRTDIEYLVNVLMALD